MFVSILERFSSYHPEVHHGSLPKNPLAVLEREFPNLRQIVAGKRVLDFGCGNGHQTAAVSRKYGCKVVGLDTNPRCLESARQMYPDVTFTDRAEGYFDLVISQNSMEHFLDPAGVLDQMSRLAPEILMTFCPPWYSPYGAHMHFWCPIPWVHLLFPEWAVMKVRAKYVKDGARRYEDVTGGLNRMSLAKFERLTSRFMSADRRYTGIRGLDFLTRIPLLRELTTVCVSVRLQT